MMVSQWLFAIPDFSSKILLYDGKSLAFCNFTRHWFLRFLLFYAIVGIEFRNKIILKTFITFILSIFPVVTHFFRPFASTRRSFYYTINQCFLKEHGHAWVNLPFLGPLAIKFKFSKLEILNCGRVEIYLYL